MKITRRFRAVLFAIAISIGLGTVLTILTPAPTATLWLVLCGFSASMALGSVLGVILRYAWETRRANRLGLLGLSGLIVLFGVALFYLGGMVGPIIGNSDNETLFPSVLALAVISTALAGRPRTDD